MTTHSAHPGIHSSTTLVFVAVAGTALAAGVALGITNLVSGDGVARAPAPEPPKVVITEGARDSWEGRIAPQAHHQHGGSTGVRDSWMPPGATQPGPR